MESPRERIFEREALRSDAGYAATTSPFPTHTRDAIPLGVNHGRAAFVRVPSVNLAERASERARRLSFLSPYCGFASACAAGRQVHLAREIAVVRQKILFGPPTFK